jgi:hypothetical protein
VIHLFLWILLWLALTAKRRWSFKLPPLEMAHTGTSTASQPLLLPGHSKNGPIKQASEDSHDGETIYWPKIAPNSPKLKVTFNDVPSTSNDHDRFIEHDGKR